MSLAAFSCSYSLSPLCLCLSSSSFVSLHDVSSPIFWQYFFFTSSKKEVIEAVVYNLNLNYSPKPDDAADALAIALTKLNEEGIN